jgi:hypothetical protein
VRLKPRRVEVLGPILGVALLLILIVWWRVDFGSDSPYPKTTTDLSNAQIALVAKLTSTTFKECGASKVAVPKDPIAVVSCAAADGDIERQALVMQFANVTVLNAHLDAHLENFTQTGACKDGKDFAGTWSKDSTRKGRVICSHSGEYHTIEWSLEGANIVTVAQAKDDARLYRWWVANR